MKVFYVTIEGEQIPFKLNKRAISEWEEKTGRKITDNTTTKEGVMLMHEALKEGHRRDGKKFDITLDQVFDWTDDYDLENQMMSVSEKKE